MSSNKEIPFAVNEMIASDEIVQIASEISKKFNLRLDKESALLLATIDVMDGTLPPTEFVPRIEKECEITHDVALQITQIINEKIFLPIREELKQIHENAIKNAELAASESTPAADVPAGKDDVLRGIESPESFPMRQRVINYKPFVPPPTPPTPTPTPTQQAPTTPPPQTAQSPTPAVSPKNFDPYRETQA